MKRCSTCGELKLLCNFAKKKNARDGHHVKCKACQQEYWKEYREKNRDRLNAKDKEYRKSNKEELKKYRESNKEKMKEY
jgi:hypothetical protein